MSEYMIVPKDSIDDTADAIKTKLGTQNDLVWGQDGFASYVEDIPSGGGTDYLALVCNDNTDFTYESNEVLSVAHRTFHLCTHLKKIWLPNCTNIGQYAFQGCSGLTEIVFTALTAVNRGFSGCSNLEAADFTVQIALQTYAFESCAKLETIILRSSSLSTLSNVNVFTGTPFASGGTGGTIYIPKTLYDALGTGTNDYKAATNWSTIDAYGTITWAKIEGSYYETHYADGTLIPST